MWYRICHLITVFASRKYFKINRNSSIYFHCCHYNVLQIFSNYILLHEKKREKKKVSLFFLLLYFNHLDIYIDL